MTKCWTVGFIGNGEVTADYVFERLDKWMPEDVELQALIPERIPRSHKGLKQVVKVLEDDLSIPQVEYDEPDELLTKLIAARKDGETPYLVILGTDDDAAVTIAEKALDKDITVKDLCAALDDVEFAEETPEPAPPPEAPRDRRRGKPRAPATEGTVTAEVSGPAHVVHEYALPSAFAALAEAIRQIVREEVTAMFPGVHAQVAPVTEQQAEEKIRAYMSEDGEYRKAPPRSRKRKGETEVELSTAEAKDAGVI